jgi:hypothetical protein
MHDQECVEVVAHYFKREFRYDFVQYAAGDYDKSSLTAKAYVWVHDQGFVVGATCFRWRDYTDAPSAYAMQWVWLHPYVRRNGYLTEAWPFFRARFDDFVCERPLSSAMSGFLAKSCP